MTHTYAKLEVPQSVYDFVHQKLDDAYYRHAFMDDGTIDMHGIGLVCNDALTLDQGSASGPSFMAVGDVVSIKGPFTAEDVARFKELWRSVSASSSTLLVDNLEAGER